MLRALKDDILANAQGFKKAILDEVWVNLDGAREIKKREFLPRVFLLMTFTVIASWFANVFLGTGGTALPDVLPFMIPYGVIFSLIFFSAEKWENLWSTVAIVILVVIAALSLYVSIPFGLAVFVFVCCFTVHIGFVLRIHVTFRRSFSSSAQH